MEQNNVADPSNQLSYDFIRWMAKRGDETARLLLPDSEEPIQAAIARVERLILRYQIVDGPPKGRRLTVDEQEQRDTMHQLIAIRKILYLLMDRA